jgi:DNA-binding response OmpR family regulator
MLEQTMTPKISPHYYQTKIALIDDNKPFLDTLELYLSQYFNCCIFLDPLIALSYTNSFHKKSRTKDVRLIDKASEYIDDPSSVFRLLDEPKSDNSELSVVVVDYDMPGLNGIEFCSKINNPCIKKILLTGQTSYLDVVNAFNNNVIDFYIDKRSENMLFEVRSAIIGMQKSYFQENLSKATMSLIQQDAPYFFDEEVAVFFEEKCLELKINEYYFLSNPPRFLLKSDEIEYFFLVFTEVNLNEHVVILKEEDAPAEWVDKLESGNYIPYFNTDDGFYMPEKEINHDPLIKSVIVEGDVSYYCAIIKSRDCLQKNKSATIYNLF